MTIEDIIKRFGKLFKKWYWLSQYDDDDIEVEVAKFLRKELTQYRDSLMIEIINCMEVENYANLDDYSGFYNDDLQDDFISGQRHSLGRVMEWYNTRANKLKQRNADDSKTIKEG